MIIGEDNLEISHTKQQALGNIYAKMIRIY